MKIQKSLRCMALASVAGLLASSAVAQQVTVSQIPGYFVDAGEFNVTPMRGAGYGADALVGSGFQSFCINRDAGITLPGTYFDTLSPAGIIIPGNLTISKGSAWLYSQFSAGTLAGYHYAGSGIVDPGHTYSQRAEDAYQLQLAYWTLEGQYWYGPGPGALSLSQDLGNPWLAKVAANFGGAEAGLLAAMSANTPGDYSVGVLNLNYINQDGTVGASAQPILVRLPDRQLDQPASIGNYVWEDKNTNGVQDATEPGLLGASVMLTDCSGNVVKDASLNLVTPYVTAANGFYIFTNLVPGQYKVTVTLPGGYVFTDAFQGGDVAKDSNVNVANGMSDCRTLVAGQYDDTVDAGAHKPAPASIGNFIWEDKNTNGVQDLNEPGISGATVSLSDCNGNSVLDRDGNTVLAIITGANGFYQFVNLAPGNYKVSVTLPSGFTFTQSFQGGNVAKDSNVNPASGMSDCRTLVAGQYDDTVDAGASKPVVCTANVCGTIFADCDGSGDLSVKDVGMKNVAVKLVNANGQVVGNATTGTNGSYCFTGLAAGKYCVTVTPPTGYKQTGASSGYYWKDSYGRKCWVENDDNAHTVDNGTECWRGRDGYVHWKDSYGRDCWRDNNNYTRCQPISYNSCNSQTNNNTLCVTVTNCQNKLDVNFAYTGTTPNVVVNVKGPSSTRCGQYVTYTCTVTNTGNVCFKGGTVCHTVGNCGNWGWNGTPCNYTSSCPPLSPGEGCEIKQTCYVPWNGGGSNWKCESKVTCNQAYGSGANGQSSCNTSVSW